MTNSNNKSAQFCLLTLAPLAQIESGGQIQVAGAKSDGRVGLPAGRDVGPDVGVEVERAKVHGQAAVGDRSAPLSVVLASREELVGSFGAGSGAVGEGPNDGGPVLLGDEGEGEDSGGELHGGAGGISLVLLESKRRRFKLFDTTSFEGGPLRCGGCAKRLFVSTIVLRLRGMRAKYFYGGWIALLNDFLIHVHVISLSSSLSSSLGSTSTITDGAVCSKVTKM